MQKYKGCPSPGCISIFQISYNLARHSFKDQFDFNTVKANFHFYFLVKHNGAIIELQSMHGVIKNCGARLGITID